MKLRLGSSLCCLAVVLAGAVACLPTTRLHAADQEDLDEWRARILRSLERAPEPDSQAKPVSPQESLRDARRQVPGADQAAARAQAEHGGRVLAVVRTQGGYRVRLLLADGRVTTIRVPD